MNRIFSPQRNGSLAVFSAQAGTTTPPVQLTAGPATIQAHQSSGGSLALALVLIDEPAPHSRCIFMDYQNRAIRL